MGFNITGLAINKNYKDDFEQLQKDLGWNLEFVKEIDFEEASSNWQDEGVCDVYFTENGMLIFLNIDLCTDYYKIKDRNILTFGVSETSMTHLVNYTEDTVEKRNFIAINNEISDEYGEKLASEIEESDYSEIIFKQIENVIGKHYMSIEPDEKAYRYTLRHKKMNDSTPQQNDNSNNEPNDITSETTSENASQTSSASSEDFKSRIDLQPLQNSVADIKREIAKFIVGQNEMIELLIISILTNGHSLIEGVPGVAKTVTAKLLAKTMDVDFSRIQFTPDLMPSDILGTSIFNVKNSEFEYKKGPIFSNIVLIDEINRAPAKTQAALFEVMAERQITMDGTRYEMELPFLVFATQNPIEQEGTYRLPEAQLDRFLFKIEVDYPSLEDEIQILVDNHSRHDNMDFNTIQSVLSAESIKNYQNLIKQIIVEDNLLNYIASIVNNTRTNANLYLGASPRASIAILNAAKANAAINGRDFVTPDDIKRCTKAVLKHRLVLTPEREMEAFTVDKVVDQILETIEIPR